MGTRLQKDVHLSGSCRFLVGFRLQDKFSVQIDGRTIGIHAEANGPGLMLCEFPRPNDKPWLLGALGVRFDQVGIHFPVHGIHLLLLLRLLVRNPLYEVVLPICECIGGSLVDSLGNALFILDESGIGG